MPPSPSLITALRVRGTIGDRPRVVCPSCYTGTGFVIVAHDDLALVLCICGTVAHHEEITEDLALNLARADNTEMPDAEQGQDWPQWMLDEHPKLSTIAAHMPEHYATAPEALLF